MPQTKKRALGSNEKIVLDSLAAAISDAPEKPPLARDIPAHARGVTITRWQEAASRYLPGTETKYKNRAFQRAMLSLVASNLVRHADGFAWLP